MLTKIQINIVLSDRNLEETIEASLDAACTGELEMGCSSFIPWRRSSAFGHVNGARMQ